MMTLRCVLLVVTAAVLAALTTPVASKKKSTGETLDELIGLKDMLEKFRVQLVQELSSTTEGPTTIDSLNLTTPANETTTTSFNSTTPDNETVTTTSEVMETNTSSTTFNGTEFPVTTSSLFTATDNETGSTISQPDASGTDGSSATHTGSTSRTTSEPQTNQTRVPPAPIHHILPNQFRDLNLYSKPTTPCFCGENAKDWVLAGQLLIVPTADHYTEDDSL